MVAAAAMFVESVVFTRTPVPRIPVLSEDQTAKDELERRRCLKELSRSKPDSTRHQLLINHHLSRAEESNRFLICRMFSMTSQLSAEERYVQFDIFLAQAGSFPKFLV